MKSIDLHTHSTVSDGTLTPTELVQVASQNGICAMALTDHDTVDGIAEFKDACKKYDIEPISGVEISAKYKTELHILGLFIDENNEEFKSTLTQLKDSRLVRNKQMLKLVQENGFDINEDDVTGQKSIGQLQNTGRAHMARAMEKKGYVKDVQEAFDKYLVKGKPCYVSRKTFVPEESIQMIKKSGGLAILAHPIYITTDKVELEKLLVELKSYGLDGVESYYSEYTTEYMQLCLSLCGKLDLLPTGGSDFHAGNKPNIQIGKVCGDMDIPYQVLEELKKRIK